MKVKQLKLLVFTEGYSTLLISVPGTQNSPVTIYLYIGSSTENQDVDQQAERLAEVYPYDIIVREPNADPGAKPKLDRLLKRLRSGDRLIVKDVSRLGRSITQAARVAKDLKSRNVMLVVDNLEPLCNPTLSVFTLIECAAQMDRDLLKDRQAIGIAKARAAGKYKGRKAIPAKLVKKAQELIAKGMKRKDVASTLSIGESTLYKYLALARQKET